ncbi:hypothetical protein AT00_11705 [Pseudoalteromonas lipolytica SCSIO 04301]|uniref:hypothetical protein n=1 Tax=Pseudoalteromonas lipolytica TaxID=570156 RepID=UPI00044CC313|nr:hypothetical protein [Pseudoalteromonas lipolytica]EWH06670.1 hypothetical protein AT00_11705 [Pseudoalteromonas lipolytica SCSIO 04301]
MEQLTMNLKTENPHENVNNEILTERIERAKERLGGAVSLERIAEHFYVTNSKMIMNLLLYVEDCVKLTALELTEIQELIEIGCFPEMHTSDSDGNPLWTQMDILIFMLKYKD